MSKELQLKSLNRLLIIMDELREKCPWDKKQTFDSLKPLTIEETYELVEAISATCPLQIVCCKLHQCPALSRRKTPRNCGPRADPKA